MYALHQTRIELSVSILCSLLAFFCKYLRRLAILTKRGSTTGNRGSLLNSVAHSCVRLDSSVWSVTVSESESLFMFLLSNVKEA